MEQLAFWLNRISALRKWLAQQNTRESKEFRLDKEIWIRERRIRIDKGAIQRYRWSELGFDELKQSRFESQGCPLDIVDPECCHFISAKKETLAVSVSLTHKEQYWSCVVTSIYIRCTSGFKINRSLWLFQVRVKLAVQCREDYCSDGWD